MGTYGSTRVLVSWDSLHTEGEQIDDVLYCQLGTIVPAWHYIVSAGAAELAILVRRQLLNFVPFTAVSEWQLSLGVQNGNRNQTARSDEGNDGVCKPFLHDRSSKQRETT